MLGLLALGISDSEPEALRSVKAMFDWPEATQTSPIMTSRKRSAFFPMTLRVQGPLAGLAGSETLQRPRWLATPDAVWPPNSILTVSPGSALPHTRIGTFRSNSM